MFTRGRRGGRRDDGDKRKKPFTAQEKGKGIMINEEESEIELDDDGLPKFCDWRDAYGVIGPVMNQKLMGICWAIAMVRAIQALYNINLPHRSQIKEFSVQHVVQHVVNNVPYDPADGIQNVKRAFDFASSSGMCNTSQCPTHTFDNDVSQTFRCRHRDNIHTDEVDGFEYIAVVNDNELRAIVARQPVVGILRNIGYEFNNIGNGIYRSPTRPVDINFHQVLIVGYGFDEHGRPYWIIQNSYGEGWGKQGFGYVHRRVESGSGSEFYAVAYPKKRGLPREKDRR